MKTLPGQVVISIIRNETSLNGAEFQYAQCSCRCGAIYNTQRVLVLFGIEPPFPYCVDCQRAILAENEQAELDRQKAERIQRTIANIPEQYQVATFETIENPALGWSNGIIPLAKITEARQAVSSKSVILFGDSGAGKTSLACALLRAITKERDRVGRYVSSFAIAKARREQRWGAGEAEIVFLASTSPVVLLDELCAESGKDTSVDEVIRERYDHALQTIYTCGFDPSEIGKKYGGGVARRVFEEATVIHLGEQ